MNRPVIKTILSKRLLGFLIKKGYKYCLVNTCISSQLDAQIEITLKPVRKHPLLPKIPLPYQNYYELLSEPFLMLPGVPETRVFVELNTAEFLEYGLI